MSEHVRMYVDPAWRRTNVEHIPLMFPFWGIASSPNLAFTRKVFDAHSLDTSVYSIVGRIEECDVVLLPYRYTLATSRVRDVFEASRSTARTAHKPLLIDAVQDVDAYINDPGSIVMRYGGYRFLKQKNDIIIPPYSEDLLEQYCNSALTIREKTTMPTIFFAGWTEMSATQYLRSSLKELPVRVRSIFDHRYRAFRKGVFVRQEALSALSASHEVRSSIVRRGGYSGNIKTMRGDSDAIRKEFVDNALNADIGLDVRGDANASTRLFELLSLGRVPVIIDTERNFPFSEVIDYSTFAIIIDHMDICRMPTIVRSWYNAKTETSWREAQTKARDAYVNYFRLDVMTRHLMREIRTKISSF